MHHFNVVMPGHSRSKNRVASLASLPGIHALLFRQPKDVDGRDKPGHDGMGKSKVRSRAGRKRLIPGTYISRWAPYDRTQELGQGQLPVGS